MTPEQIAGPTGWHGDGEQECPRCGVKNPHAWPDCAVFLKGRIDTLTAADDESTIVTNLAIALTEAGNPSQYKTIGEYAQAVYRALRIRHGKHR